MSQMFCFRTVSSKQKFEKCCIKLCTTIQMLKWDRLKCDRMVVQQDSKMFTQLEHSFWFRTGRPKGKPKGVDETQLYL